MLNDEAHELDSAPLWYDPISRFLSFAHDVEVLVNIHESGLRALKIIPHILGAHPSDIDKSRHAAQLALAHREAEYASKSVGSEFMFAHSVVGLWSGLEVLVEDLVGAWIASHPEVLDLPDMAKVRIPVAEYMRLGEDERIGLLVTELQRTLRTELASGATRFEKLVDAVGLGGKTPDQLRRALFEMWQVRNLWAHRSGVSDRKFTEICPWLNYDVGERVVIDLDRFNYYLHATHMYAVLLLNRCRGQSSMSEISVPSCFDQHLIHMKHHVKHPRSADIAQSEKVTEHS